MGGWLDCGYRYIAGAKRIKNLCSDASLFACLVGGEKERLILLSILFYSFHGMGMKPIPQLCIHPTRDIGGGGCGGGGGGGYVCIYMYV